MLLSVFIIKPKIQCQTHRFPECQQAKLQTAGEANTQ